MQQSRHANQRGLYPEPDTDAKAHGERLAKFIRTEMIQAGGGLPFHRFMDLALYAPGLGYYVAGSTKLGADGDFVTAPEISPLFGHCLARQCDQVLAGLDGGSILEFGAGSGKLALAILEELQRRGRLPEAYLILEPSPELRARQAETLGKLNPEIADRVGWVDALPQGFVGVMIANEVLDAMPVHRFVIEAGEARELHARPRGAAGETDFEEYTAPAGPDLVAAVQGLRAGGLEFADGYHSEINLRAAPWIQALGQSLKRGLVLLVDYGYPRREYYMPQRSMGTLMCHYRHRAHADPYRLVGLQDITAYVDFTAVAEAGLDAGLSVLGYATQAHFLLGCGLEQMLGEMDPTADPVAHFNALTGAKQLILPGEMGERFQVLGLGRQYSEPLMGFSLRDLRERL